MDRQVIPIAALQVEVSRQRKRQAPKGRRVDAGALEEVRSLLGRESRQRDLLIEHLHKIQDRYGHLSAAHLAALAQEMRLAQTEVFEVASFYHHFDIVKEGESAPPALTVRVCDGLSCALAGAGDFARLRAEARAELVLAGFGPEYVDIRVQRDLAPAEAQRTQQLIVLGAARLGGARLIDNLLV